jgi:hypothetical protein
VQNTHKKLEVRSKIMRNSTELFHELRRSIIHHWNIQPMYLCVQGRNQIAVFKSAPGEGRYKVKSRIKNGEQVEDKEMKA